MVSSLMTSNAVGDVFVAARNEYQQTKARLAYWNGKLNADVDVIFGINMLNSITDSITRLQGYAAIPGLNAYVQAYYDDSTFDAVAAINNLVTALQAMQTWIQTHIPNTTYAPAQTAPLLTLVQQAQATLV